MKMVCENFGDSSEPCRIAGCHLASFRPQAPRFRNRATHYAAGLVTAGMLVATPLSAQVLGAIQQPTYKLIDSNGVNLLTELPQYSETDLTIGSLAAPMTHQTLLPGLQTYWDSYFSGFSTFTSPTGVSGIQAWCAALNASYAAYTIGMGSSSELFCGAAGVYVPASKLSDTLVSNSDGSLTLTQADGTTFQYATIDSYGRYVTSIATPDGRISQLAYRTVTITGSNPPVTMTRLQSVTRNDGLQFRYTYALNTTPTTPGILAWLVPIRVTALNNAVDYCDPMADTCTTTVAWPYATYVWSTLPSGNPSMTITNSAGTTTRLTMNTLGNLIAVKAPTSASADTVSYHWWASPSEINTASNANGQVWTYSDGVPPMSTINLRGVTSPTGVIQIAHLRFHLQGGVPVYDVPASLEFFADDTGRAFNFDTTAPSNLLKNVVDGAGVTRSYLYDARGNIKSETTTPNATGGTATTIYANYDATCTLPVKCNKPNSVQDALGNFTYYYYDPTHGGVTKVTSPSATVGGVSPEKRYAYVQKYAWIKTASGTYAQAASPVWVLNQESYCINSAYNTSTSSCTGNDEVVTTYDYGPASGPNNLFLRGIAVTAGGQIRRTCYGNDVFGNRISETLPNAGLGSCP